MRAEVVSNCYHRTVRINSLVGKFPFATLKGLSHEIDFKNIDKNLQNLA